MFNTQQRPEVPRSREEFLANNVAPVINITEVTNEVVCSICYSSWEKVPVWSDYLTGGSPGSILHANNGTTATAEAAPANSREVSASNTLINASSLCNSTSITFSAPILHITFPCNHAFHTCCFIRHTSSRDFGRTCPMCRGTLWIQPTARKIIWDDSLDAIHSNLATVRDGRRRAAELLAGVDNEVVLDSFLLRQLVAVHRTLVISEQRLIDAANNFRTAGESTEGERRGSDYGFADWREVVEDEEDEG